jgi:hypothetical protein
MCMTTTTNRNYLYGNNTTSDLTVWHKEIRESLERDGTLPEALADLFVVRRVVNPDGSPRYMIDAA